MKTVRLVTWFDIENITNSTNVTVEMTQCLLLGNETEDFSRDFRYIMLGPVLSVIILFSAIGNVLTLAVFRRRYARRKRSGGRSTSTSERSKLDKYLTVLSVWDLLLVCGSFFLYNLPNLLYGVMPEYGPYVHAYPPAYTLINAARTGGIWILIVSALDRYFALCHPLLHRVYYTQKRTNIVLGLFGLFSFAYGVPRYFQLVLKPCLDWESEQWIMVAHESAMRDNRFYWYIYKITLDFALVTVGPFVILSYLSVMVCTAVRKLKPDSDRGRVQKTLLGGARFRNAFAFARGSGYTLEQEKARKESAQHIHQLPKEHSSIRRHQYTGRRRNCQDTQRTLNLMLVAVLTKFLVCHSLPAVLDVCETVMSRQLFETAGMENLVHAATVLVVLNSALNVVTYLVCSKRFRSDLMSILCWPSKQLEAADASAVSLLRPSTTTAV